MIISESRLRKIIRHVLEEAGRSKRRSLGLYKTQAVTGPEAFRQQVHQTRGQRMGDSWDDGYDSIMGFDEADGAKATKGQRTKDDEDDGYDSVMGFDEADGAKATKGQRTKDDEDDGYDSVMGFDEADPPAPSGCKT